MNIVILGATKGIGRAVARQLAARGDRVSRRDIRMENRFDLRRAILRSRRVLDARSMRPPPASARFMPWL